MDYARCIAAALHGVDNPVVVGHSLAGLAIGLVPSLTPVRALVYLAALLPEPGMSWRDQQFQAAAMTEVYRSRYLPRQVVAAGCMTWPPEVAGELFYHDCPAPDASVAVRRLRAQAATPVVEITPLDRFPDIPARYLVCEEDRALDPSWSHETARRRLGVTAEVIPGGHSPFWSTPALLAEALLTSP
jgi:pimeloyl-ACP methyl ester carboxylesterase